jgi:preprotein translocase subunit Sec63
MSGTEIIVFVVFLLLGYWIVFAFLERKRKPHPTESQPATQNWHHVLSVDANASVEQIRAAYQILMSQYHPDKVESLGQELRELAERKSKEITVAYREAMRSHGMGA